MKAKHRSQTQTSEPISGKESRPSQENGGDTHSTSSGPQHDGFEISGKD